MAKRTPGTDHDRTALVALSVIYRYGIDMVCAHLCHEHAFILQTMLKKWQTAPTETARASLPDAALGPMASNPAIRAEILRRLQKKAQS